MSEQKQRWTKRATSRPSQDQRRRSETDSTLRSRRSRSAGVVLGAAILGGATLHQPWVNAKTTVKRTVKPPALSASPPKTVRSASLATVPPAPALREGEPVPQALVRELFSDSQGVSSDIVVGQVPGGFPAAFPLPAGSTVLGGSIVSFAQQELTQQTVIGVFRSTEQVTTVRAFFAKELPAAGWKQPAWGSQQTGGFEAKNDQQDYVPWCAGTMSVNIQLRPTASVAPATASDPAATSIRIVVSPNNFCATPVPTTSPDVALVALPTLKAPAGMTMQSTGSAGYGEFATSGAVAKTDLTPAALLDHFDAQLVNARWQQTAKLSGPIGARATYTTNVSARTVKGTLLIVSPSDGTVALTLTRGETQGPFGITPPTIQPFPAGVPTPVLAPATTVAVPPPVVTTRAPS